MRIFRFRLILWYGEHGDYHHDISGIAVASDFKQARKLFFREVRKDWHFKNFGLLRTLKIGEKKAVLGDNEFDWKAGCSISGAGRRSPPPMRS